MSEAAKAVAFSTSQLVSLAKSATEQKEKKQEIQAEDDSDFFDQSSSSSTNVDANLAGKVKHFEQHIKIKKLEKDLENAREDLGKMNKADYLAQ